MVIRNVWEQREVLPGKGKIEISGVKMVFFLELLDGYTGVYVCQNSVTYFEICALYYVNYVPKKDHSHVK